MARGSRLNRMHVSKPFAALVQAALLLAVCCGTATAAASRPSAQKKVQVATPAVRNVQNPPPPPSPRDQQVISAAESAYASGMRNYHAGDLAAAKQDFDNAVDTMLSSGLDLKNSPALSDEFEHIVDAVNTLEMDALNKATASPRPWSRRLSGWPMTSLFPSIRISAPPPRPNSRPPSPTCHSSSTTRSPATSGTSPTPLPDAIPSSARCAARDVTRTSSNARCGKKEFPRT